MQWSAPGFYKSYACENANALSDARVNENDCAYVLRSNESARVAHEPSLLCLSSLCLYDGFSLYAPHRYGASTCNVLCAFLRDVYDGDDGNV